MKNLNLNKYGVQEMNTKEMQNTNGGEAISATAVAVTVVAVSVLTDAFMNPKAHLKALKKGWNSIK